MTCDGHTEAIAMPIHVLDMPALGELPELPEDVDALTRRPRVADEPACPPTAHLLPPTTLRCAPASAVDPPELRKHDETP
jgi:hypothetical protein